MRTKSIMFHFLCRSSIVNRPHCKHIPSITLEFIEQITFCFLSRQGMRQSGCSGFTNPQIFGTSPFAPADFEASSTMCTRCFENQSSPGCTCTRRSKFLTHFLTHPLIFGFKYRFSTLKQSKVIFLHETDWYVLIFIYPAVRYSLTKS